MTLKTLKPKVSITLILDDEFIRYCELNKIDNIEKFAHDVFNKGFTVIKYGDKPPDFKPIKIVQTPIPPAPSIETKKIEKDNIYDE